MKKCSNNVLVLGGGTQGLAIVRNLKLSGFYVVLFAEKGNYADASRYADKVIYCNLRASSKDYLDSVKSIIDHEKIDAVIPMGDVSAEFLSKNKYELLEVVKFQMPDFENFKRGTDKNSLMALCREKKYPHPLTIGTDEIDNTDLSSLPYPMLIKPNITCGARGMTLCHSYKELIEALPTIQAEYGDCHLQKYVKQGGTQVEFQLHVNANHKLVNSSVIYKYRWYPEKGGSSSCATSARNDKMVDILYHVLLDLNWVGFADFDTIEDPDTGELLIMELNPRVPACVKCAIEGGIGWGKIIANEYLGIPQKKYEYKEGEILRHLGFETLWFLKSPNRWKMKPSYFKFIGKHIHYQDMSDWTDPMPFFVGSWHNIKKLLTGTAKSKIDYGER
ncbi:MAG: ATP-grasp domain-containing protein [Bacteroidales bacterium]|nr:ATP-grasp domain-containing protein [Bacteroidales bacterium]